jgi:hypothetical protein
MSLSDESDPAKSKVRLVQVWPRYLRVDVPQAMVQGVSSCTSDLRRLRSQAQSLSLRCPTCVRDRPVAFLSTISTGSAPGTPSAALRMPRVAVNTNLGFAPSSRQCSSTAEAALPKGAQAGIWQWPKQPKTLYRVRQHPWGRHTKRI